MHKSLGGLCLVSFFSLLLGACSMQQKIGKAANALLIRDSSLMQAHVGIAVQDPETGKFLYQYQSDKFFTPASNTKIFSAYAAMKYLPIKLPAAILTDMDTAVLVTPTGDPSFLHPEFSRQPLLEKLKSIQKPLYLLNNNWNSKALGMGWSWDDYSEEYMTERSAFPVYGNQVQWFQQKSKKENPTYPGDSIDLFVYSNPEVNWPVDFGKSRNSFAVQRSQSSNAFQLFEGKEQQATVAVPYITNGNLTGLELLKDTLHKEIRLASEALVSASKGKFSETIYSQPTDTLLRNMMYRSDNFYADQCLEMVSQVLLKKMDEQAIIQELLKKDLSDLPQAPRWVDGSGLSRFNQFTPEDMIKVLNKIKAEQPWERITGIFAPAGTGTLRMYKSKNGPFIYAKSGSLTGVVCLSGYVYSKDKKWLTFSIMINNHNASGAVLRKRMEGFLEKL